MEFMLVLYEDPDLVATDEQHKAAVERVGEYAMGLLSEGVLKGGAPLHPVAEARRIRIRDGERRVLDAADRARARAGGDHPQSRRPDP